MAKKPLVAMNFRRQSLSTSADAAANTWSAMTDIMTVVVMVFMLVIISLALKKTGYLARDTQEVAEQLPPLDELVTKEQFDKLKAQLEEVEKKNAQLESEMAYLDDQNEKLVTENATLKVERDGAEARADSSFESMVRMKTKLKKAKQHKYKHQGKYKHKGYKNHSKGHGKYKYDKYH